jgi:P-type Ca2+ transporter type 2C
MTKKQIEIYNLQIEDALASLSAAPEGLSDQQVTERLVQYGRNELSAKKTPLLKRLLEPFASYFVLVIVFAALISVWERKWFEAIIISAIIIINAIIYYFQQLSVSKVLKTLKSQDTQKVTALRGGKDERLASELLVPGDIIRISEGMKVPADGRLIDVNHIQCDESVLTGESLPVHKHAGAIEGTKAIYEQDNMLFKGTYIKGGTGLMLVTKTGNQTEFGEINTLAAGADNGKTPVERKIDQLTKRLLVGIGCITAIVFLLAIARGIHLDEALRFTLSLAVSAVPEGLPVALTLVLLLSARKMAKQKALVKKISAVETMGSITMIATDKTGTITKNKLAVADTYTPFTDKKHFYQSLRASLNNNKSHDSDPLDILLGETVKRTTLPKNWKVVHEFPFDQQLRMSGVVWKHPDGYRLYVKGAPEQVLHHANRATFNSDSAKILKLFTNQGFRTLAFAHKTLKSLPKELSHATLANLTFDGFVGMSDQLRRQVRQAITEAHHAGIKVVMLTGDHLETASHIAHSVGIAHDKKQVTDSTTLASGKLNAIRAELTHAKVFARVLPEHKFTMLKAVKTNEITAMTGDGVNDIPALVEADVGLAMGSGTDAAKDASDIVLMNSNFHTIVNAVRTGRTVLANVKKMLVYLLGTSGGEVLTMLSALALNIPLPITAIMVLWVNLVTDGVSVIPLGLSPSESHQMQQKPRDPKAPLLDRVMLSRAILLAVVMAATILVIFKLNLPKGEQYAQTMAFLSLICIQWANAFNMNFEYKSWLFNFFKPNFKLYVAIGGSALLNVLVFMTPLRNYFSLSALTMADAVVAITIPMAIALFTCDAHKLIAKQLLTKPV